MGHRPTTYKRHKKHRKGCDCFRCLELAEVKRLKKSRGNIFNDDVKVSVFHIKQDWGDDANN